jgi:protein translocase SecG subunit
MQTVLLVIQIILSICLVASILLQSQGSGLGAAWGGGGETYHTRRGIEKVVFIGSIVCAALFTINSIVLLIVS